MSRYTRWLAGIVVSAANMSASAEIQVPPGFVVDTLLDQIDGTTPRLEAIRNPDYGFGVVAASVDNGILKVLRISESSADVLATTSGFSSLSLAGSVRFDATGLFANRLYVTVIQTLGCVPWPDRSRTDIVRIAADGGTTTVASVGGCEDYVALMALDFTDGIPGYSAGAYLYDSNGYSVPPNWNGTSLYHMDANHVLTLLDQHIVPPGRDDLDLKGMEFDPTELYGSRLVLADSEDGEEVSTIWYLLPDLTFDSLTPSVGFDVRLYSDMTVSPGGSLGQTLYVVEHVMDAVMAVSTNGEHTTFASGFDFPLIDQKPQGSITISDDGEHMFVSDANGVYRIRAETTEVGPALVMREPWVEADDVHTGTSGVDSLRLLWSERVLFDNEDVTITNEDAEPVAFSVSGSNSQFMLIAFGEVLLDKQYTITIHDSVVSAETGGAIDGDNDGLAGGDAVLAMEHRNPFDHDRDGDVDLLDFGEFQAAFTGP